MHNNLHHSPKSSLCSQSLMHLRACHYPNYLCTTEWKPTLLVQSSLHSCPICNCTLTNLWHNFCNSNWWALWWQWIIVSQFPITRVKVNYWLLGTINYRTSTNGSNWKVYELDHPSHANQIPHMQWSGMIIQAVIQKRHFSLETRRTTYSRLADDTVLQEA